jgi:hypothetical protein
MDMYSGGECKLGWELIFIEAPIKEAKVIFYNMFNRNPERVTCTCCGEDYSIDAHPSLEQASAFDRGCDYDKTGWVERPNQKFSMHPYQTLDEFVKRKDVRIVRADQILPSTRMGDVPPEGYVWAGG